MMQERGVEVDPSTIMRWVHRYAPELEKRVRHHLRSGGLAWLANTGRTRLSASNGRAVRLVRLRFSNSCDFLLLDFVWGALILARRHWQGDPKPKN